MTCKSRLLSVILVALGSPAVPSAGWAEICPIGEAEADYLTFDNSTGITLNDDVNTGLTSASLTAQETLTDTSGNIQFIDFNSSARAPLPGFNSGQLRAQNHWSSDPGFDNGDYSNTQIHLQAGLGTQIDIPAVVDLVAELLSAPNNDPADPPPDTGAAPSSQHRRTSAF